MFSADMPTSLIVLFVCSQIFGLAITLLTRVAEGGCCQLLTQRLFYVGIAFVAGGIAFGMQFGTDFVATSGIVLCTMLIGVIYDPKHATSKESLLMASL